MSVKVADVVWRSCPSGLIVSGVTEETATRIADALERIAGALEARDGEGRASPGAGAGKAPRAPRRRGRTLAQMDEGIELSDTDLAAARDVARRAGMVVHDRRKA